MQVTCNGLLVILEIALVIILPLTP